MKLHMGIDIGSTSINTVLLNNGREVVENHYHYSHGKPFQTVFEIVGDIVRRRGEKTLGIVALTGTGGELGARLLGGFFVNEIVADSASVTRLYPQVQSAIEMGGEDSKLIRLSEVNGHSQLNDFVMNSMCAAGTGSFLD